VETILLITANLVILKKYNSQASFRTLLNLEFKNNNARDVLVNNPYRVAEWTTAADIRIPLLEIYHKEPNVARRVACFVSWKQCSEQFRTPDQDPEQD